MPENTAAGGLIVTPATTQAASPASNVTKVAVDKPSAVKAATVQAKAKTATPLPWIKIGLGVFLLLCILGYVLRNKILGQPVDMVAATTGELIQTVVASGRLVTPQRMTVSAQGSARVVSIPVDEGQSVKKGQVLIALDDKSERASVAQAQAAVAQGDARLRQLREVGLPAAVQGLVQSQATVEQARKQFERTRSLVAQGFISQAQLDEAKRNLDIATSQASAAGVQVNTHKATGSDVALASAAAQQTRANLQLAQVKLEAAVIRAPVDGILIARSVEPGDIVQPGKTLMVLAPSGETQIVVQLDEKNLAKLTVGQKALGSADAFAEQRFNAVVTYINPGIDATRGSVEIKLRVIDPPAYLRQDMTVSIDIETARRAGVLVVPTGALHDGSGDAPWVLVVRSKRAVKQVVKLGLRGDSKTEVLTGITQGEMLVMPSVGTVEAGKRVREQRALAVSPSSATAAPAAPAPAAAKMSPP